MSAEPRILPHPDGKHWYVDYGGGVVSGALNPLECRVLVAKWRELREEERKRVRDAWLDRAIGAGAPWMMDHADG